jgi:hypothetical protein
VWPDGLEPPSPAAQIWGDMLERSEHDPFVRRPQNAKRPVKPAFPLCFYWPFEFAFLNITRSVGEAQALSSTKHAIKLHGNSG